MITESNMKVLAVQLPVMKRDLAVLLKSKENNQAEVNTITAESEAEEGKIKAIEEALRNLKDSPLVSLPEVVKMREEIAKHRHNLAQYEEFLTLAHKNRKVIEKKADDLEKNIQMVEEWVAGRGKVYEFKTNQARNP